MTSLERFDGEAAFPPGVARWLETNAAGNFFTHPSWYRVVANCADSAALSFFALTDEPGATACAAMLRDTAGHAGLRRRTLHACTSIYTTWYGPAYDGAATACRRLAREMATSERYDVVSFDCLDPADPSFEALRLGLMEAGFATTAYRHFVNWYEVINADTFDDYIAGRTSVLRNTYRRKEKKLFREHDVRVSLESEPEKIEPLVAAYETVYRASWKEPEPHPNFVPALARTAAQAGALRMGVLSVDGVPAASQIWLTAGSSATIFKLAYDDALKKLSAGTVLTGHMMRQAIEVDGVREVDFGRGHEAYKAQWLTSYRERWGLLALNKRTAVGNLLRLRHFTPGRAALRRLRATP